MQSQKKSMSGFSSPCPRRRDAFITKVHAGCVAFNPGAGKVVMSDPGILITIIRCPGELQRVSHPERTANYPPLPCLLSSHCVIDPLRGCLPRLDLHRRVIPPPTQRHFGEGGESRGRTASAVGLGRNSLAFCHLVEGYGGRGGGIARSRSSPRVNTSNFCSTQ